MPSCIYLDDIARYASPAERVKVRSCYTSLPRQLAKENTRSSYSTVEHGGRARKFESSVDWLTGAETAQRCRAVTTPQFPLSANEDERRFRLYANDTGLLLAMHDFSLKAAVIDNTLTGPMKGGLCENLVACMLAEKDVPLRYWMSSDTKHEIDFLVDWDGSVVPVEVKAGRGSTASLNAMLERPDVRFGYKLIDGNVGRDGKKITLPLWMAMFLFE
jgi:predicted AAA+ superfamily ATPase